MKEISKNYLWTDNFHDIDNQKLYETCIQVDLAVRDYFKIPLSRQDSPGYGSVISEMHMLYNIFNFPDSELHKLLQNMGRSFASILKEDQYYLRSWVNLFSKGTSIPWHNHWEPEFKAYHGFYCVRTEGEKPSHTEYKIPGESNTIIVPSMNSKVVIGKSENDKHRSSPWENDGYRVTIAFDIIPLKALRPVQDYFSHNPINNYIPLPKF